MASAIGNWQEVKITVGSDDPAAELEAYITSNVKSAAEYNLLYQRVNSEKNVTQQIMIQIDAKDPLSVKCYAYDFDGRPVPEPLKIGLSKGVETAFPESIPNKLMDICGERRARTMLAALMNNDEVVPNYVDTQTRISSATVAIEHIEKYKEHQVTQKLKQGIQSEVVPVVPVVEQSKGLFSFSIFGGRKPEVTVQEPGVRNDSQSTPKTPRKGM